MKTFRKGELIYVADVCFVTVKLKISTIYFFIVSSHLSYGDSHVLLELNG